jgi:hypothetical protein
VAAVALGSSFSGLAGHIPYEQIAYKSFAIVFLIL